MSRIRTVKPEFWTSEQVVSCSPLARLLFIGLWNFCDDHGVHQASYVRLKAEVFPVDNLSINDVKRCINELITNELLREYLVDDKSYWIVTGWSKHQRIDKPTYRHPLPLSGIKKIEDISTNQQLGLVEHSSNSPRDISEQLTTERNGMESNGKEEKIYEVKTSSDDVDVIFSYWQAKLNHPKAKLDKKRRAKIKQALNLGYSLDDLKKAIDGCANTPFNQGQNDRGHKYDDIGLILRDASNIERFINNASSPANEVTSSTEWMSDAI